MLISEEMVNQGDNHKEVKKHKDDNVDSNSSVELPGLIAPPFPVLRNKEVPG